MNDVIENKVVRDARGRARRMARAGGGSYQQCLDKVAEAEGHAHWKAFMASHPSQPAAPSMIVETDHASPPTNVGAMARERWLSAFTGQIWYERDQAEVERLAAEAPAGSMKIVSSMLPETIGSMVAASAVAAMVMRTGPEQLVDMAKLAVMSISPTVATIFIAFAIGWLVGRHDGSRHLRVRVRSWFSTMQFGIFLYGYVGLIAGDQPRLAALYAGMSTWHLVVVTAAGIALCWLLGRMWFRAMLGGERTRRGMPKAAA